MNLQVPDDVLNEAIECKRNHICLVTGRCGDEDKCQVDHESCSRNVLFLAGGNRQRSCSYLMSFGPGQVCTCPVHYYVYTHHPAKCAT